LFEEVTEPNLEVRIGAIYSLERIAQDSLRDHWQIMEIIATYIRQSTSIYEMGDQERKKRAREDIVAALTVIGRRSEKQRKSEFQADRGLIDLDECYLAGFYAKNLNFERTSFCGSFLSNGHLENTGFKNCNLDECSFKETNIVECHFDRSSAVGANFAGTGFYSGSFKRINFIGAKFKNSYISQTLVDGPLANFSGSNFVRANFDFSFLSFLLKTHQSFFVDQNAIETSVPLEAFASPQPNKETNFKQTIAKRDAEIQNIVEELKSNPNYGIFLPDHKRDSNFDHCAQIAWEGWLKTSGYNFG
jgi:uncharacterized protein YjbI with pentapeptide repeats